MHPVTHAVLASSLTDIISPLKLISNYGTLGLALIVFAETGLLIGFFLPGDSLLFLAGAYSATQAGPMKDGSSAPHLNLGLTLIAVAVAALLGAEVGYLIGRRAGPVLFDRPESRIFKHQNVVRAHEVLERYGEGKAIVLARFVPVVRTFMNPVCGVAGVSLRTFTQWNIIGGLIWSLGVTLLGYGLGKSISIDKYILPITALIIVASAVPILLEVRKQRAARSGSDSPA